MNATEYLQLLIDELAFEFATSTRIRTFSSNPDIVGAHAEAAVRALVRRCVSPLRVSTGTILFEGNCGQKTPQFDTMIWSLRAAPAIFEKENFAIVPRGSCLAVLEIKNSAYAGSAKAMSSTLRKAHPLLAPPMPPHPSVAALGVFCTVQWKQLAEYARAESCGSVVALLRETKSRTFECDRRGLTRFINCLIECRRADMQPTGQWGINDQLMPQRTTTTSDSSSIASDRATPSRKAPR